MRRVVRTWASLVATSLIAAASALTVPLSASATSSPTEVAVYPADQSGQWLTDRVVFGGVTGYLHQPADTATYVWTTYGTGQNRVITGLPNAFTALRAGGDRMAYKLSTTPLTEVNFADNTSPTFTLPSGTNFESLSDNRLLVRTFVNGVFGLEVLTYAADGSFVATPVTLPNGASTSPQTLTQPVGDPPSVVVTYRTSSNVLQDALVDLTTAAAYAINVNPLGTLPLLSADHVAFLDANAKTLSVMTRADIIAGTAQASTPVPIPPAIMRLPPDATLVGDQLIMRIGSLSPFQVNAVGSDGSVKTLVPTTDATNVGGGLVATTDGAALVAGGTSKADWAVRRLAQGAGVGVTTTVVQPLSGMLVNAGVTISHNLVRHIDALPDQGVDRTFVMFGHDLLDPNGASTVLPPPSGLTLPPVVTCAPGVACVIPYDEGDGVLLITSKNQIAYVFSTVNLVLVNIPPGSSLAGGSSDDYVIINNPRTLKQYITPTSLFLPPARPLTAAALSIDTLWTSSAAGLLTSTNLLTNSSRLVRTGGSCRPQDVQATQRWVYWSCGGNAAAGVIDLQTHKTFSAPPGRALLGNGYLVRHLSNGNLVLTDFHSDASSGSVTLANVPQGRLADDRNVTFSVDPFGGDVAYVDGNNSVHVIDPNVP